MESQKVYHRTDRALSVLERIISDIKNKKVMDFNAEKVPMGFTTQYGGEWAWKFSVMFNDGSN